MNIFFTRFLPRRFYCVQQTMVTRSSTILITWLPKNEYISEEDAKFFIELHSFKRKSNISISITSSQTTLVIRRQSN